MHMKKTWKKLISVGCATCLLVSCIPEAGIVLAAETEASVETQSEEAATSGTWGTCEWNLDEDGVLTISGGVGESIESANFPWKDIRSSVKRVVISGNIYFNGNDINLGGMFWECENLEEIQGLEYLDTSNVTNMSAMFSGCHWLKEVDVSEFDTSNVTGMGGMFNWCSSLEEVDVSGFDTSNVTSMGWIFNGCSSLEKLDVSGFDTGNVTNMDNMFSGCSNLEKLDVSRFNTSNVTTMWEMFSGCSNLEKLDVSGFDTGSVTDMGWIFNGCSSLEKLDVSGFDTGSVTDMGYMFCECNELIKLDVSRFDTKNVTDMEAMFGGCSSLEELDLRNFDLSGIAQDSRIDMFYDNYIETITIPNKFKNEESKEKFINVLRLEGLRLGKWKNLITDQEYNDRPDIITEGQTYSYEGETTISGTWGTCNWVLQSGEMVISGGELNSINKDSKPWLGYLREIEKMTFQSEISFLEETSLKGLFSDLRNIEYINGIEYFDTKQITNMSYMFSNCGKLVELDLSHLDTSQVTDMGCMFNECGNLKRLDLSNFDTSKVKSMFHMFYICGVRELDLSSFDVSNVSWIKGDYLFGYMDLSRVVLSKNMGEQESDFITELQKGMKPGSWYDVTADIAYEGLPDTMQAGHEYINRAVYAVDKNTGISLKNIDSNVFDENLELTTDNVSTDSNFSIYAEAADKLGKENLLYNIYLQKNGEVIQPDGQVQVSIPLPEGMRENAKVYYIAEDGTAIDMNAEYIDGNLVFVTDHFSVYAVVNSSVLSGDIDGNGKVNLQDSALLRRYLAGWDVTIDENAADVDGNGKVNLQDSALLRRYLTGWDVTLK